MLKDKIAVWSEEISTRIGLLTIALSGIHVAWTGHVNGGHGLGLLISGLMVFVSDERYSEAFRSLIDIGPRIISLLRPSPPKETRMSIIDTVKADIEAAAESVAKTALVNLPSPYSTLAPAIENLLVSRSAANWLALVEAIVTTIEAAEAKTPPVTG